MALHDDVSSQAQGAGDIVEQVLSIGVRNLGLGFLGSDAVVFGDVLQDVAFGGGIGDFKKALGDFGVCHSGVLALRFYRPCS